MLYGIVLLIILIILKFLSMNIMSNGITYVYEKSKIQSDIAIWFSKLNQNYVFTISEILFSL